MEETEPWPADMARTQLPWVLITAAYCLLVLHIFLGTPRKHDSLPGETWLGPNGLGSTHKQFYGPRAGRAGQDRLGWAEMAQALLSRGPSSVNCSGPCVK